jgi:YNFM family putative membrane transporter
MPNTATIRLQATVFFLVAASFTNVYITQPVLPILQKEFGAGMVQVSFTVSAVILGIALANLPFGYLSDRFPLRPIVAIGGIVVVGAGMICAATDRLSVLIAARFLQGLFIPAFTTCVAAYLARTLPADRLNVVMGTYVSATVLGGLGGRLLGGWIHPLLHWRFAFVAAAALIGLAALTAWRSLPPSHRPRQAGTAEIGYLALISRWELLRIYACAAASFSIFSSVFNYLPFRLAGEPFHLSTNITTMVYLSYIVGIFMGPVSGRIGNRIGSGSTLIAGTVVVGMALILLRLPSFAAVWMGLIVLCAGFFAVHAAAVGALNRKLTGGQGRANALYVLFYYIGGWIGITVTGMIYQRGGWHQVMVTLALLLSVPLAAGIVERRAERRRAAGTR